MDSRAFGASGIPLKPKSTLFSDEEGGVEPSDLPISPKMAAQFGFQSGTITPDTDNAAARAGVVARAYKPTLEDPGMERRAAFGMDPSGNQVRTPTRQESAKDDAYVAAQVAPVQAKAERIAIGNQRDAMFSEQAKADNAAQIRATAVQRREALKAALENKLGIPLDDKALVELVKAQIEQDEKTDTLADMAALYEKEQGEIDSITTPDPATKAAKASVIRAKYLDQRNRLQEIRTNRRVQLSKQPPVPTDDDLTAALTRPGG